MLEVVVAVVIRPTPIITPIVVLGLIDKRHYIQQLTMLKKREVHFSKANGSHHSRYEKAIYHHGTVQLLDHKIPNGTGSCATYILCYL